MEPSDRLLALLDQAGRPYTLLDHAEARSAEEAAAARGTPLAIGGKTVVMKIDRIGWAALVVGSDRRIEGRLLRHALRVQRYRFATAAELVEVSGLRPGEVPPFGRPLFDLALYVGRDVAERAEIAFAAASATRSVRMATADWLAVAAPVIVEPFTVPADGG
jgi:prolyl-tRNA editing enzyme YbaK/EbsC (Cys-tRNA(Pro) deacylase)